MDKRTEMSKAFNVVTKKYRDTKVTPDVANIMVLDFIDVLKCYYDVDDSLISIVLDSDGEQIYFKPGNQYTLDLLHDIVYIE